MGKEDDAALVAAALAEDPEAFSPIVARYQDAVFGVALARLGNFHDAEDVAQGAFVEAFKRLGNLKGPARLGAWLRSITIHRAIDHLRRRRETAGIEDMDEIADRASSRGAGKDRQTLRDQVMDAVGRLSKTQRETTTLFYINGYSVEEVAGIQEVPVGTIKRRLHDAREKLKEEMLGMVEDVLKSEAPKEDFGRRVLELLSVYKGARPWSETLAEIRKIGAAGLPGFIEAFKLPHWQSRRFASQMLTQSTTSGETVVQLLKQAVTDSNKKVRRHAFYLLGLDVDDERKRKEFLPLLIPLLEDRSARVRRRAAFDLRPWAADVPLAVAARALANEKHPATQGWIAGLVRAVLEVQDKGE
ncbi:MAG TPA: sigma-70 family RNA polymerase sigma factor [Planctomycetota bacterium]|nr:sigma-70 family RNA polymerase sigma factor [Planctomycetota bacterium]